MNGYAREQAAREMRRAIQRREIMGMNPRDAMEDAFAQHPRVFTSRRWQRTSYAGGSRPQPSINGQSYENYKYPSGFVPYGPGGSGEYLRKQDELRNHYATRHLREYRDKVETGYYEQFKDDPAYNSIMRAFRGAMDRWSTNPGRKYGDLAWFRQQMKELEKRKHNREYVKEQLQTEGALRRLTLKEYAGYGPEDAIMVKFKDQSGKWQTIHYQPFYENGAMNGTQTEDLREHAGVVLQPEYYNNPSAAYRTTLYDRPRVQSMHVWFFKPGEYIVNGKKYVVDQPNYGSGARSAAKKPPDPALQSPPEPGSAPDGLNTTPRPPNARVNKGMPDVVPPDTHGTAWQSSAGTRPRR